MDDSPANPNTTKIKEAIESGEAILIIYDRGSHPGTVRRVAPISITETKLRAVCLTSGETKSFILSSIRFPADDREHLSYDSSPGMTPIELIALKKDLFENMGWHVEINQKMLSLHGYRKNSSQPLKRPAIYIHHSSDSEHFPWVVSGPSKGSSFKKPERAIDLFMEEVRSTPPPKKI